MVEKILNNTTPYGKIRASHEGSLHSSTLKCLRSAFTQDFPRLCLTVNQENIVSDFV